MPPVVIILTESEATHVKELIEQDRDASKRCVTMFPNDPEEMKQFHAITAELDEGILKKLADLDV